MDVDDFDFRDNQRQQSNNNNDLRNEAQQLLSALSQVASTSNSPNCLTRNGTRTKVLMLAGLSRHTEQNDDILTSSGLLPNIQLIDSLESLLFV